MIEEKKYKLDGLLINYIEEGEGSPIVFLHNGAGLWQSWQKQIAHFSEKHKVYALDWPGCGKSDYPEGDLNMNVLEHTLDSFIEEKNLKDFILIGNCIGASAALNYAIKKPQQIKKLMLFNMCPGDLIFPKIIPRGYVQRLANRPKAKARISKLVHAVYGKKLTAKQFPRDLFGKTMDTSDPFYLHYAERLFWENQARSRHQLFFNAHTYNLKPIIANKNVPEHVLVWGEQNAILNVKTLGKSHYKMLKSKEFHIIEKTGHLCMYEAPERINNIIENYIHE